MPLKLRHIAILLPLGALLILAGGCSKDLTVAPVKPAAVAKDSGPGSGGTPAVSTISLSPTSVVAGATSTARVTLTAAAPSGGTVVGVTSSNSAVATVPATLTIAAGSTSGSVTVTSQP